ncbi:ion channel protein [Agromyces mangrovi Wang et al. 2018]|uniref:ion channel protein n=1 Tax=Agromyces mangrovi TaxID=1858653 RepID=UPI0025731F7C|nr:ion channel protein [Agromyces mangrovi]BDZ65011.1 putative ion-transport protein [Agromyces mangrovi]
MAEEQAAEEQNEPEAQGEQPAQREQQAADASETPDGSGRSDPKLLLKLAIPSIVIGIGSALVLAGLDLVSEWVDEFLWDVVPGWAGVSGDAPLWIIGVLTLAGLLTGLIVRFMPGHGGEDPATESLFPSPMAMAAVPGVALAAIITLSMGVSLGPEGPTLAINVALAAWVGRRFLPQLPIGPLTVIVVAGTVGALFGSPVGAALLVTSVAIAVPSKRPLWDRMFPPLTAAAAGSITMHFLGSYSLSAGSPTYDAPAAIDFLWGVLVLLVAIAAGLALVYGMRPLHRVFHAMRNPIIPLTIGGLILGLLGAIGGPITLFKGLDELQELTKDAADYDAWQLAGIVGVKIVALLIAAAAGFRGGRIFPTIFIGGAIGILAVAVVPAIPLPVAMAAAVLGVCLVVVRDGWLSLFIAIVVVGDIALLPMLCVLILPGWLLVARLPEMRVEEE